MDKRLETLSKVEAGRADDGYGLPVKQEVLLPADEMLKHLKEAGFLRPGVFLTEDGHISLGWMGEAGDSYGVEIGFGLYFDCYHISPPGSEVGSLRYKGEVFTKGAEALQFFSQLRDGSEER